MDSHDIDESDDKHQLQQPNIRMVNLINYEKKF